MENKLIYTELCSIGLDKLVLCLTLISERIRSFYFVRNNRFKTK